MSYFSKIIIGCSRALSLRNPVSKQELIATYDLAVMNGISQFDTADIYAQGDSEALLGLFSEIVTPHEVNVITKGGYRHGVTAKLVKIFKPILKKTLNVNLVSSDRIDEVRGLAERQCFDVAYLRRQLRNSCRKLRTRQVDCYLLHDPDLAVIADRSVLAFLKEIRVSGLAMRVGVSVNDYSVLLKSAEIPEIEVIQLPLVFWEDFCESKVFTSAERSGKKFFIREIGQKIKGGGGPFDDNLAALVKDPRVHGVILGISQRKHLEPILEILQSAENPF